MTDGIRLTEIERLMGRLMRAPDHEGGDTGSEGGDASSGDSGSKEGAGGDQDSGQDGGDTDDKGGNETLIGQVAAKSGTGKDGEGSGKDEDGADKPSKDNDADDDAAAKEVPEAYDLKLTLGEGDEAKTIDMDPVLVEAATPVLKDLGLTNEQANKLLPIVPKVQEQFAAQQTAQFEKMAGDWAKASRADTEIGGKNWEATEHSIGRFMDRFGNPELNDILEQSRLGNHIGFVRMAAAVGAALGEDSEFPRGNPTAEKVDTAALHYPEDAPQAK